MNVTNVRRWLRFIRQKVSGPQMDMIELIKMMERECDNAGRWLCLGRENYVF